MKGIVHNVVPPVFPLFVIINKNRYVHTLTSFSFFSLQNMRYAKCHLKIHKKKSHLQKLFLQMAHAFNVKTEEKNQINYTCKVYISYISKKLYPPFLPGLSTTFQPAFSAIF